MRKTPTVEVLRQFAQMFSKSLRIEQNDEKLESHSNQPRKICIVVNHSFRIPPVMENSIAQVLVSVDFSVTVICPRQNGSSSGNSLRRIRIESYPRIPLLTDLPPINFPFVIARYALKTRSNVYEVHDLRMIAVALVLKLLGRKVIYHIGDDNPSLIAGALADRHRRLAFLFRPVRATLAVTEGLLIRRFDCTIALTKWLKRDRLVFSQNIVSNYYYPEPAFRNAAQQCNRSYEDHSMVYVGAISRRKGLAEMFEVLRLVKKKYGDAKLYIIGAPSDPDSTRLLYNYLRDGQLRESTVLVGRVPHGELPRIICKCQIGLALLHPFVYSYKIAIPFKVLDIMTCGVPVVVGKGMLESERLVKASGGGIIVDLSRVSEMADSIIRLLGDKSLCEKMGRAALDYVDRTLPFEDFVTTLLNVYDDVLSCNSVVTPRLSCFRSGACGL